MVAKPTGAAEDGFVAPEPGTSVLPPFSPAEATPELMLRLAATQTACIAISDAGAHLRRTSILAEAAFTAGLAGALQAAPGERNWAEALDAALRTMQSAIDTFAETGRAAVGLVRSAETSAR